MNKSLTTLIIASTFTLAACGGGGGDSTTTYSYTGPTAAVTLDSDNIGPIADNAMSSNEMLFDQSIPLVSVASNVEETTHNLFETTTDLLDIVNKNIDIVNTDNQLVGAIATVSCSGGGNVTYDGDVTAFQNDTLSAGNSITVSFNSCIEGGTTLNGSMSLTVNSAVGDYVTPSGIWELGYTISFNQLSFDGTSLLMHGGMSFTAGENVSGDEYTNVYGTSLFVMSGAQQALMTNFDMSASINTLGDTTVDSDYTYAGTDIGGSINVTTSVPFETAFGETYPHTGSMVIVGASGAKIWLDALNQTQVFIAWDILAPFDGTKISPDGSDTVNWVDLANWTAP